VTRYRGSWFRELRRILIVVLLGELAGWYLGYPLQATVLVLSLVLLLWLHQLWRIQAWLNDPERDPPDSYGLWGDIFDQIHRLQARNREAKERLQSTVDYLRSSFASIRDGVVMLDDRGAIRWGNRAAERLLGIRYPADSGQVFLNLVRFPDLHRYVLRDDYRAPLELSAGSEREQRLQVEITRFGEGDRLIFVRDVTDKFRLDKMRRDFVGNVSHELRTPLTVITGYLEMLKDPGAGLEPRYMRAVEQMMEQAARMETLLKDLLWLSRIEGAEARKHESINIAALLGDVRSEVRDAYPGRAVELRIETDQGVYGDYRELRSAALNLISNAIRYSPVDSTVRVFWRRAAEGCELAVEDQGIGIASEHIPRLTERFYRVDDSRSFATGGTGLGLAIVKHVASAHGARLRIESEPGRGSVFTLVFPPVEAAP